MSQSYLSNNTQTYNKISRLFDLKPPPCLGGIDKQAISLIIGQMEDSDKQALLFSKLIEIKYYRQTGFSNNMEDVVKQEQCWQFIVDSDLLPLETSLVEIMAFIKNDGYIVQRKMPSEFKKLLVALSDENKDRILNKFNDAQEQEKMRSYLADATGLDWGTKTSEIQDNKDRKEEAKTEKYKEFKESAHLLADQRWATMTDRWGKRRDDTSDIFTDHIITMCIEYQQSAEIAIDILNTLEFD